MFEKNVLDKGFVRLLNISGAVRRHIEVEFCGYDDFDRPVHQNNLKEFDANDTDPALVARTSFAKGMEESTQEQDEQLVEYLIRNNHTTPLEFTTVYLEFKMPIFIARQVMRHRTASINEVSGRYVILPNDWYIPDVVRGKHNGGNKQGSEDNLHDGKQNWFKEVLEEDCQAAYWHYQEALSADVCPEQARMFLHLNHYTQFVWKQDLHNLMHFLALRLDEHAQWEIRQYAEAIYELLNEHLPKSMEWFDTYRRKLDGAEKDTLLSIYKDLVKIPVIPNSVEEQKLQTLAKLLKRQGLKV